MKKWLNADVLALLAITLTVFLFFFRLLFPTPQLIITPDFGQSDAVTSFSTKHYLGNQLLKHHIPLWTSLIGGGLPVYAHGAMGTFFLPNLVLFSFLSPVYAYTFVLFLSICFLGWGMYWWLRMLDYEPISSVFGAITLALSGYSISQFSHITIVQSLSLFPAIAGCTYVLAKEKSWRAAGWLSLLISQQIFVGFPQSVFITMLFTLAYYLWITRASPTRLRDILQMIVAFLGACGIAAVQLLPSLEYLSALDSSGGFSQKAATVFSYPIKHLITLLHPYLLGNPAIGTYPHFLAFEGSIFWENTAYIGIVPLICIAAYILFSKRSKNVQPKQASNFLFFSLLCAGSLLLMTGKYSPVYFIFSFWPFSIFRVPSRFIWLFVISLVVICTHAFNFFVTRFKHKRLNFLMAFLGISMQIFTIFFIWSPYHNLEPAFPWLEAPTLSQYIVPDGYTMTIGGERLYNNTYQAHGWSSDDPSNRPSYILRNTFTPDKNMLWSVPQIRDYAGRQLRRSKVLDDLLSQTITDSPTHATISALGSKLLSTLSVKNIISTLSLTQNGLLIKAQLSDASHMISLYTNPAALPKVYIAGSTIPVKTIQDAVKAFESDAFVPGRTVLVEDDKILDQENHSTVHIDSQKDGYYAIRVTNPEKSAVLVITETYYPGWQVTIDGRETKIFPVNVKHIGALVPQGSHKIVAFYSPSSFVYGAWVSIATLSVTVCLMVFVRRAAI